MDEGLIHPNSLLKDAPASFDGYDPENFDHGFAGPIRARDALVQSRNVPAVELESRLERARNLYTLLRDAGIRRLQPEPHYGLTIALGSAEVSPEEMGTLYAMLANRGVLRPLRRTVDEPCRFRREVDFAGGELADAGYAEGRRAARCGEYAAPGDGGAARGVEDGDVVRLPRCVDRGGVRSLRAGGVGGEFRWRGESGIRGAHGGGSAGLSRWWMRCARARRRPPADVLRAHGGFEFAAGRFVRGVGDDRIAELPGEGEGLVHPRRLADRAVRCAPAGVDRQRDGLAVIGRPG